MIYIVFITWIILQTTVTILACLATVLIYIFISEKFSIYYKRWERRKREKRWEKEWEEYLQQKHRRELHRKEMEKYPLFFWRELEGTDTSGNLRRNDHDRV